MPTLQELLQPKKNTYSRYKIRIDGKPKTGKTTLAYTASKFCPPPAQWNATKPVELKDILTIQFEENSDMYPRQRGLIVPNILNWSDSALTWADLKPAIHALPAAAQQYRDQGIETIVVDTLSAFNAFLLREIVDKPNYDGKMERIRAYGNVNAAHVLLFDMLAQTGFNVIGLVHLKAFQPFGEDGQGSSAIAQEMKAAAEKQVSKIEAGLMQGMRTDYIPDMRPDAAKYWAQNVDAGLIARPEEKVIRAGVTELQYKFLANSDGEFNAGSRWQIPAVNDFHLRPVLEARYNNNNNQTQETKK